MTSTAFLNSFNIQDAAGLVDLRLSSSELLNVQIDPDSAATKALYAGDVVLFSPAVANSIPVIDEVTVNTAVQDGVIVYTPRKNSYTKGQRCLIAIDGTIIKMVAAGSINRDVAVEWVVADKEIQAVSSGRRIGRTLDVASAKGDIIRVKLDFDKSSLT